MTASSNHNGSGASVRDYAIDVRGLNKHFGDKHVVRDFSLQVRYGEIFGFVGPMEYYYNHIAVAADPNAHNVFIVNHAPRKNFAKQTTKGIAWGERVWHKVRAERDTKIRVRYLSALERGEYRAAVLQRMMDARCHCDPASRPIVNANTPFHGYANGSGSAQAGLKSGDVVVAMGPQHARLCASAGLTRAQVQQRLWELAERPQGNLKRGGNWREERARALGFNDGQPAPLDLTALDE